jgi:hypothetical protein
VPPQKQRDFDNRRYVERRAQRRGVYCVICGMGPYVKVGVHAAMIHGVSGYAYRRRFPGALVTHPDYVPAFTQEADEKGWKPGGKKPYRFCRKCGRALRGQNLLVQGKAGARRCRHCTREHKAQYQRTTREARRKAAGSKLCECGCGTTIPALKADLTPQRFAPGHWMRTRWEGHVTKKQRREAAGTRLCECGCGTRIPSLTFHLQPARFADGHQVRARWAARDNS